MSNEDLIFDRKAHWENVYQNKAITEVSWYQPVPQTSLEWIKKCNPRPDAAVIDVGGGDGFLTDHLLAAGFSDLSVLDISQKALDRAQVRLGSQANSVHWICADASAFQPSRLYDIWHDRAAFHFLNSDTEIAGYRKGLLQSLKTGGKAIIATFSDRGPLKCSGIEIRQYTEERMSASFDGILKPIEFQRYIHPTPFGTEQEFLFGLFERI